MKLLVIKDLAKSGLLYNKWNWDYFADCGRAEVGIYNNIKAMLIRPLISGRVYQF
jgi:hypothetical protein